MDPERASVISAGFLLVVRILLLFESLQLAVSLSGLPEGVLIDCFDGEGDG